MRNQPIIVKGLFCLTTGVGISQQAKAIYHLTIVEEMTTQDRETQGYIYLFAWSLQKENLSGGKKKVSLKLCSYMNVIENIPRINTNHKDISAK